MILAVYETVERIFANKNIQKFNRRESNPLILEILGKYCKPRQKLLRDKWILQWAKNLKVFF
jgi:hypothetical protein